MKILMLSWEYPPKSVGGLSTHVYYLVRELTKLGHEVHLITCEEQNAPKQEIENGVYVYRVEPYNIETSDFTKWVMHLNFAIIEVATRLINEKGAFDIIHSHDWLTTFSAKVLKSVNDIPLICTIHATEYGRNNGIKTELQKYISDTEAMLCNESLSIIVCSEYMRKQLQDVFHTTWEKIHVIANGVNHDEFEMEFDLKEFRKNYALEDEKIVLFFGRHVFEKGIHILIEAAPGIVRENERTKFVIGGRGPMTDELKRRVSELNLSEKFEFLGYVEDEVRNKLYRVSDVAVFPSLYEPFGIVALEAMSSGCPIVVSDTGGLSEIIQDEVNGLKCYTGSVESLQEKILKAIKHEELSIRIREQALKEIHENYIWSRIAASTIDVYKLVIEENYRSRSINKN